LKALDNLFHYLHDYYDALGHHYKAPDELLQHFHQQNKITYESIINVFFNASNISGCSYLEYDFDNISLTRSLSSSPFPFVYIEPSDCSIYALVQDKNAAVPRVMHFHGDSYSLLPYSEFCSQFFKNRKTIKVLATLPYEPLFQEGEQKEHMTPLKRFMRILRHDRKDISYLYAYALFYGLLNLSLPVGIQAIITLIMGARVSTSLILLIVFVIAGTILSGGLQILQLYITESLQQKLFVRSAIEFTFRIPKIKIEALRHYYAPELMNRFFDTLTIQKGLPKLLIDFTTAGLQILFGLILLSFYHPFFVFFGILLILLLGIVIRLTGPRGVAASLRESKYKYEVVYWMEEIARTLGTFKLAGTTNLPMKKTDYYVDNYLTYRKKHFKVLVSQYGYIIGFKALITAGLLILGSTLVMQEQINIGQFFAAEIIIILILNSVEKLILSMETVYDVLTAVEKLAQVTELPLERHNGMDFTNIDTGTGIKLSVRNLTYQPEDTVKPILRDVAFELNSGESLCVAGHTGSGKSTLIHILSGLIDYDKGVVAYNDMPLRNINLMSLRNFVAGNFVHELIFKGSVLDNITLGRDDISMAYVVDVCKKLEVLEFIQSLPEGFQTQLVPEDRSLPRLITEKLILARCLAENPRLLLLEDYNSVNYGAEGDRITSFLINKNPDCTLIVISNDISIARKTDKVLLLQNGAVAFHGPYSELEKNPTMTAHFHN
jgi:ABC-type bacteriocin/lantibiotic exporter with double-glycine peptidase domain